jgi:hypothetical protein
MVPILLLGLLSFFFFFLVVVLEKYFIPFIGRAVKLTFKMGVNFAVWLGRQTLHFCP